jgi:hypothetical protein
MATIQPITVGQGLDVGGIHAMRSDQSTAGALRAVNASSDAEIAQMGGSR